MDTVVVIPTYNEVDHIEALIRRIRQLYPDFDILIVDDNSPDGTGELAERIASTVNQVKVLHRARKNGLGRAYVQGFQYVLACNPPYSKIIQMDADFSHDPVYIKDLVKAVDNAQVSIGTRYMPGGAVPNWRLNRRVLSLFANFLVRAWLGIPFRDCTSGFRCFRREVLEGIRLDTIRSNGYYFQIEMALCCQRLHYTIAEVPIRFAERKTGNTKLGFAEIWEAFWMVLFFRFFR